MSLDPINHNPGCTAGFTSLDGEGTLICLCFQPDSHNAREKLDETGKKVKQDSFQGLMEEWKIYNTTALFLAALLIR